MNIQIKFKRISAFICALLVFTMTVLSIFPTFADDCSHDNTTEKYVSNNDGSHNVIDVCTNCSNETFSSTEPCVWEDGACKYCNFLNPCTHTPDGSGQAGGFSMYAVSNNDGKTHEMLWGCFTCNDYWSVTENCTFNNGVCGYCQQEQSGVCFHEVTTFNYTIIDSIHHNVKETCFDCGELLDEYNYDCYFMNGVCMCGNTNCAHDNTTEKYVSNYDGTHNVIDVCTNCSNEAFSSTENCSWDSGACKCGSVQTDCLHEHHKVDYTSLDATQHERKISCYQCGGDVTFLTEGHTFHDGACVYCDYICTHTSTTLVYNHANTPSIEAHGVDEVCTICTAVVNDLPAEACTIVNGACTVCKYVYEVIPEETETETETETEIETETETETPPPSCPHADLVENISPVGDGTHNIEMHCTNCDTSLGVKNEPCEFTGDTCLICGYIKACEHISTYTVVGEPFSSDTHYYTEYCTYCKIELLSAVTGCSFVNGLCECGNKSSEIDTDETIDTETETKEEFEYIYSNDFKGSVLYVTFYYGSNSTTFLVDSSDIVYTDYGVHLGETIKKVYDDFMYINHDLTVSSITWKLELPIPFDVSSTVLYIKCPIFIHDKDPFGSIGDAKHTYPIYSSTEKMTYSTECPADFSYTYISGSCLPLHITKCYEDFILYNTTESGFYNLFYSVFDSMVNVYWGILDFNLLGVNIASFCFSLLTLCVVIIIIKKVK